MALNVGDIVQSRSDHAGVSPMSKGSLLVMRELPGGEYWVVPVTSTQAGRGGEWELPLGADDLESGAIPVDSRVLVARPRTIGEKDRLETTGRVKSSFLDTALRHFIKCAASGHHALFHQSRVSAYVPAAGKVLDEQELFGMIDASLDMWLTTGRFNDLFEQRLSEFLGIKFASTTNSGSSANLLALSALTSQKLGDARLKPGDEVITVAAAFPTTVAPIIQHNLVPVFVDVELGTYNIEVDRIHDALSDKTRAIFIAHTLGNPFNIHEVSRICRERELWLIEDNCDALGSRYDGKYTGTHGHIATLSFYPAHHMTMGEGGAVVTDHKDLHRVVLSIRDWGRDCWCPTGKDDTCRKRFDWKLGNLPAGYDHKFIYSHLGYNLKITDWQAAIGLAQLRKLPSFIQKRRENFDLLLEGLKEYEDFLILPRATEKGDPAWFGFPITVKETGRFSKMDLVKTLEANNIGTRHLFAGNILRQPALVESSIPVRIGDSALLDSSRLTEADYRGIPNTDTIMKSTFWIGLWPGIRRGHIDHVVSTIREFSRLHS